jgi:hypothetical protein
MTATIILVAVLLIMGTGRGVNDPMPPGTPRGLRRYYRRNRLELARGRHQQPRFVRGGKT